MATGQARREALRLDLNKVRRRRDATTSELQRPPADDVFRIVGLALGLAKGKLARAREGLTAAEAQARHHESELITSVTQRENDAHYFD